MTYNLTDEQKAIAAEYSAAQMAFQSAQLTSVPMDPTKRAEHDIWYAQVSARQMRAYEAYQNLIRQMAAQPLASARSKEGKGE